MQKVKKFSWTLILVISMQFMMIGQTNVVVNASPSVNQMMDNFINNGKANENIKAWRIQIITTDDRREMEEAMAMFGRIYPDINKDWKHVAPYYQVRVGFYENKNKLIPKLLEMKKFFPAATPVHDNVSKRALVNQ